MSLINKTYEDPDGIWYISEINKGKALITCIQEDNPNYLMICEVPVEEAEYYLSKTSLQN